MLTQLVGTQDGRMIVPVYDWSQFLSEHFRKVPKMKSYQHFMFTSARPGIVQLKALNDSEESQFRILSDENWTPDHLERPQCITPSGLSAKRQWYLYDQIREFCREDSKDLVCPLPEVPKPGEEQGKNPLENTDIHPQPKRPRVVQACPVVQGEGNSDKRQWHCGKCSKPGHTRRTCTT